MSAIAFSVIVPVEMCKFELWAMLLVFERERERKREREAFFYYMGVYRAVQFCVISVNV